MKNQVGFGIFFWGGLLCGVLAGFGGGGNQRLIFGELQGGVSASKSSLMGCFEGLMEVKSGVFGETFGGVAFGI